MSGYLPRAAYYPTLLYNVFLEKVTSRRWYDRIDCRVIVGALPFPKVARELVDNEKVTGVISLNEEYELKRWITTQAEWEAMGVKTLYLPTVDLVTAPSQADLRKGVSFILDQEDNSGSIYIHCKAGRTRSATLAACYLMTNYRCNPTKAIEKLKMRRPHVWLRQTQIDAVDTYYKENVKWMDTDSEV